MNFEAFKEDLVEDQAMYEAGQTFLAVLAQMLVRSGNVTALAQQQLDGHASEQEALDDLSRMAAEFARLVEFWKQEVRLIGLQERRETKRLSDSSLD